MGSTLKFKPPSQPHPKPTIPPPSKPHNPPNTHTHTQKPYPIKVFMQYQRNRSYIKGEN